MASVQRKIIQNENVAPISPPRERMSTRPGNKKRTYTEDNSPPPVKRRMPKRENGLPRQAHLRQNIYHIKPKQRVLELLCSCAKKGLTCSDKRCENRAMNQDCSVKCKVVNCQNRRFSGPQNRNPKLQKFDTLHTGKGVRAKADIKKGELISEYIGEVIDKRMKKERKIMYTAANITMDYFMKSKHYFIDPTRKGNIARYLNHACQPNCKLENWLVPGDYLNAPRIVIFAKLDIKKGEELTFHYGNEYNLGNECGCITCRAKRNQEQVAA